MIRPVAESDVGLTDSWLVFRSAAATPLLFNRLISAAAFPVLASRAPFALCPRVWTPMTTVTVSGVLVTVPRPRVVMPVVDPAPVNVAAAGSLLPEQPASARAPAARTATLDKPRFIGISVQCLVHQGRSGTPKSCTPAGAARMARDYLALSNTTGPGRTVWAV